MESKKNQVQVVPSMLATLGLLKLGLDSALEKKLVTAEEITQLSKMFQEFSQLVDKPIPQDPTVLGCDCGCCNCFLMACWCC